MANEADAVVDAFLKRFEEIHFNGGLPAFHALLLDIRGTVIRKRFQELRDKIDEEVKRGITKYDDPRVGAALKHLAAMQRRAVAQQRRRTHVIASATGGCGRLSSIGCCDD